MSEERNNDAAFPWSGYGQTGPGTTGPIYNPGMSLRDWFAGQAMAATITGKLQNSAVPEKAAEWAYRYADAMLAARDQYL